MGASYFFWLAAADTDRLDRWSRTVGVIPRQHIGTGQAEHRIQLSESAGID